MKLILKSLGMRFSKLLKDYMLLMIEKLMKIHNRENSLKLNPLVTIDILNSF